MTMLKRMSTVHIMKAASINGRRYGATCETVKTWDEPSGWEIVVWSKDKFMRLTKPMYDVVRVHCTLVHTALPFGKIILAEHWPVGAHKHGSYSV